MSNVLQTKKMIFKNKKKNQPPRVCYNPDPETIGRVVQEHFSADQQFKATVIQNTEDNFTIYLYQFDDSDKREGWTDAVGWRAITPPSFTDTIDLANGIAKELIMTRN